MIIRQLNLFFVRDPDKSLPQINTILIRLFRIDLYVATKLKIVVTHRHQELQVAHTDLSTLKPQ